MLKSYYRGRQLDRDKEHYLQSAMSGIIEIMDYDYYTRLDKFNELNRFYEEVAREIYSERLSNYNNGFWPIGPQITFISDRIYLFSFLYLEKDVPELSSMIFKLFVEYLNILLSIALKHEIAIRGFAAADKCVEILSFSGKTRSTGKKENLVLSDMLKIFSFEEIFPEGVDQPYLPPVMLRSMNAGNFLHGGKLLDSLNAIGIHMPIETRDNPFSEVAIYSDMLAETIVEGKKMLSVNWMNWVEKHPDCTSLQEVRQSIARLSLGEENNFASLWKKFGDAG